MKKLIFIVLLVALVLIAAGCRVIYRDFDYAIIRMPDGEIKKIEIDEYCTHRSGIVKIFSKDGSVYFVSSINTVFIKEPR